MSSAPVVAARLGDRRGERRRQRPHAAFALDRLDDDRRRRSSTTAASSAAGSFGRHEADARQQRLERRAVVLVRGDRQRAERPAVERLLERDDLRARLAARVPVAARELQARFDRFGAAVAEERARQPRERRPAARRAGPAAGGRTGSTCGSASAPAPRSRAPAPGARGRARRRRCPTAGRGTRGPRRRTAGRPRRART